MGVEIIAMFDFGLSTLHLMILGHTLESSSGCWVCIEDLKKKPFLNPKRPWTMSSRGPESDQRVMLSQCSYIYPFRVYIFSVLTITENCCCLPDGGVKFYSFVSMFYSCKTWKRLNSELNQCWMNFLAKCWVWYEWTNVKVLLLYEYRDLRGTF